VPTPSGRSPDGRDLDDPLSYAVGSPSAGPRSSFQGYPAGPLSIAGPPRLRIEWLDPDGGETPAARHVRYRVIALVAVLAALLVAAVVWLASGTHAAGGTGSVGGAGTGALPPAIGPAPIGVPGVAGATPGIAAGQATASSSLGGAPLAPDITTPASPGPPSGAAPSGSGGSPSGAPGGPPPPPPPSRLPPPPQLAAAYATIDHDGDIYHGRITLTARSGTAADWTVTVTLFAGGSVTGASGAAYQQSHDKVMFGPLASTPPVAPGSPVTFTFEVHQHDGPDKPKACTVGKAHCSGL
jgi:hypothetical protein